MDNPQALKIRSVEDGILSFNLQREPSRQWSEKNPTVDLSLKYSYLGYLLLDVRSPDPHRQISSLFADESSSSR